MDKKIEQINILKTVGGYRVNVCTGVFAKEEKYKNKEIKEHFFIFEEGEIEKIKNLEKLVVEKIDSNKKHESYFRNVTNINIMKIDKVSRVNVSVDTLDQNGVLLETNHRYSFSLEGNVSRLSKEDNEIVANVSNIEKYVIEKLNVINF